MEAVSLASRRHTLSRLVLEIEDPNILERIEKILNVEPRNLPMPCTYTIEDVQSILSKTETDALTGKGRTWNEVRQYIHHQA